MKASAIKEGAFAKELEDELMKFTTDQDEKEVGAHLIEQTEKIHHSTVMNVNIMECPKFGVELAESEHSNTTECSTSFDDSDYEAEGVDAFGDSEALSQFHGHGESEEDYDGSGKLFRVRKKPSSHWRSFIHPIMWRCKWVELKIKKLEAQAKEYDRKLEECSRRSTLECVEIKLPTFPLNHVRSEDLRRKKRRRDEAIDDIATHMSHHNLFSYHENSKFIREAACHLLKISDVAKEEVIIDDDEQLHANARNDNFSEHIFRKVEYLHSHVTKLRARVDKVTREQAAKFSCTDNCCSSVAHDATCPWSCAYRVSMGTYIASQLISEVSIHEEEDNDVLIDNQRAREEMSYYEEVKNH